VQPKVHQKFDLGGQTIDLPAHKMFLISNSFKFSPEQMSDAANFQGLKAHVFQHKSMALLLALR